MDPMTTYIAVYFDAPTFDGYPFDEEEYRIAYHDLAQAVVDRGGRFFIARGDSSLGNNRFASGWIFNNGGFDEHRVPFTTHCILNKGHLQKNHTNMVNDPTFDTLCNDKWRTFQEYGE